MEQTSAPRTMSADVAFRSHDALDWPPLSSETVRWAVVVGGAIFAASIGALLGGAMSL